MLYEVITDQSLDLTPLSGLVNLVALTLRNNKIIDLTPLAGMSNLRYLDRNNFV